MGKEIQPPVINSKGTHIKKGNCGGCGRSVKGMTVEQFNNHYDRCSQRFHR